MNTAGRGENKRVILAIIITVIILLAIVAGYFLYKNFENKRLNQAYSLGYNKSLQDIAQGQTQTGSILIWKDNSVQVVTLQDVCSGTI